MIRLIACDLDETLLSTDRTVSTKNKEFIKKAGEHGVKFVCATGRGYSSIQNTLDEIGLKDKENEYTISYNGGVITENKNNRLLHFEGLDHDTAEQLFQEGTKHDVCIHVYTLDTVWIYRITENEKAYLNGRMAYTPFEETNLDFLKGQDIIKVLYVNTDRAYLQLIEHGMEQLTSDLDVSYSSNRYLEFNKKGVNKGAALKRLAELLDVDITETAAIGDNYNDLCMIKAAGIGAGVANTVETMKAECDLVLSSTNDEDAIAEFIEQYVL